MELQINRWGNSLGIRLPKTMAEEFGVTSGSTVNVQLVDGKLVISADPMDRLRALTSAYTLDALLADMPEDDAWMQDEELRAWRDAEPMGREITDDRP